MANGCVHGVSHGAEPTKKMGASAMCISKLRVVREVAEGGGNVPSELSNRSRRSNRSANLHTKFNMWHKLAFC